MRLTALQRADGEVALFHATLEADDGTRHTVRVLGRDLDSPVAFATLATERTKHLCSSPFVGDSGGWHAHLGDLLRANADA